MPIAGLVGRFYRHSWCDVDVVPSASSSLKFVMVHSKHRMKVQPPVKRYESAQSNSMAEPFVRKMSRAYSVANLVLSAAVILR